MLSKARVYKNQPASPSALTQAGLKRMPKKNGGAERYKESDRQLKHLEIPIYQPLMELPVKGSVFQQCFVAWGKWFRARFTFAAGTMNGP
jgi:hypothetical protein